MSRYTARIRALEARLRPGECRRCSVMTAMDWVTVHAGEPIPAAPVCEACGEPRQQFVIIRPTAPDEPNIATNAPRVDYREAIAPLTSTEDTTTASEVETSETEVPGYEPDAAWMAERKHGPRGHTGRMF